MSEILWLKRASLRVARLTIAKTTQNGHSSISFVGWWTDNVEPNQSIYFHLIVSHGHRHLRWYVFVVVNIINWDCLAVVVDVVVGVGASWWAITDNWRNCENYHWIISYCWLVSAMTCTPCILFIYCFGDNDCKLYDDHRPHIIILITISMIHLIIVVLSVVVFAFFRLPFEKQQRMCSNEQHIFTIVWLPTGWLTNNQ